MKRNIFFFLGFSLLLGFSSCSLNDDTETYYLDMGVIKGNSASTFLIEADAGFVLRPVDFPPQYEIIDGKRVLIKYTVANSYDDQPYDYTIRIESIQNVLTKNIVHVTSDEIRDTLKNDPVDIKIVWISKAFLNVEFVFKGHNKTHYFDLAKDPFEQDKEGFITLDLHHNAKEDDPYENIWGIISFPIEELQIQGENSVKIFFRTTGQHNTSYTKEIIYNYGSE